jgi:integral membrane protein
MISWSVPRRTIERVESTDRVFHVRRIPALFVAVAIAEACSWAALLTGMFFKYVVVHDEIGVRVAGPIHGGLFLAYLVVTVGQARTAGWRWWVTLVALACSIPPFATVAFERWARSRGLLTAAAEPVGQS